MKLAAEVDLGKIFKQPKWFCFLTFSSDVSRGVPFGASGSWKIMFSRGKFGIT